ncbi:gluconokinase [Acinetobacter lactucae]|jgi:gluconokinase|uniref:Gluconokinase n=1 Tax=Acinetobacter lactucae TaxID=1785128 RepID=A0AB35K3Q0_9GAMM|nr:MULTISPECIES: gluconokinase [Acinetobacter calcoaceticus/baumannii complex]ARD30186.1 gluconokinase [Acinetobacter lactucae]KQE93162.1 gluconokinase [Acinetobacter lactucae]KYQ79840.1 gluconokinase [Acinetobacter lactucae]MBJ8437087.1 gluconokinase [Acinetobacter lactucae]MCG9492785.1 gluconokinase [Acinetobacter pittii]
MIVIAMGVCGTGKTLIGELLSEQLACEFLDGDTLHSAANKSKMSQGIPLTDEDRMPWLQAIRKVIEEKQQAGETAVFTCSSLKRVYRDILRGSDQNVQFVYLKGSYELLQQRLAERAGHFFDPSLLQTQLDTLEEPDAHEAITIDIALTPEQIVVQVMQKLGITDSVCRG